MKSFLACLLALFMLGTLACPTAAALAMPGAEGGEGVQPPPDMGEGRMLPGFWPPSRPLWITEVIPPKDGDSSDKLLMLQPGDSLSALDGQLPNELYCNARDAQNIQDATDTQVFCPCPVVWDLSDTAPLTLPGRVTIHGTLMPEADHSLAEGFDGKVTYAAVVVGERPGGAELLRRVFAAFSPVGLLPLGVSADAYCSSRTATCLTGTPGEYFDCPIIWDYSRVKQDVPGRYPITGTPDIPAGFSPPPSLKPFTRSLVVMDDTKADLSAASFEPSTNCINCSWIYEIPMDTPVRLEYAVGTGDWKLDDQNYLNYQKFTGRSLHINLDNARKSLELQTDYYFRIVYGPEGQSVASNVLHLRLENWDFLSSETEAPPFDIDGDRDGGDQGGSTLPPLVQPAPEPPHQTDSGYQPPVLEAVTETSTILSGLRLSQLTAKGGTVLFEKQGVAAELSASFLDSLQLEDGQLLEVTIQRPTPDTFCLALHAGNEAITALPDTVVRLPQRVAGPPLECTNQEGLHISDVTYEPESGTIRCTIPATGTYRIQVVAAEPVATEPAAVEPPPSDLSAAPDGAPAAVADQPPLPPAPAAVEPPAQPPAAEGNPSTAPSPESWIFLIGTSLAGAGWLLYRRRHRE